MRFKYFIEKLGRCQSCVDPAVRDLRINSELRKAYYIPESRAGLKEYVLIADGKVPGYAGEPGLYFGIGRNRLVPVIDAENPEEIHFYINSSAKIIFTTLMEDLIARKKIPEIGKNIAFEMSEII